jgi:hypothetical protein
MGQYFFQVINILQDKGDVKTLSDEGALGEFITSRLPTP